MTSSIQTSSWFRLCAILRPKAIWDFTCINSAWSQVISTSAVCIIFLLALLFNVRFLFIAYLAVANLVQLGILDFC